MNPVGKCEKRVRSRLLLAAGAAIGLLQAEPCVAGLIVNITETGGDLVFDVNGNLDITGWTAALSTEDLTTASFSHGPGNLIFGLGETKVFTKSDGLTFEGDQPTEVVPLDTTGNSSSGTGQVLGYTDAANLLNDALYLPAGFTSGGSVDFTFTFAEANFATLGSSVGDSWTVTLGGSGDTIQYNAVPEPSGLVLMGVFVLLCNGRRRAN